MVRKIVNRTKCENLKNYTKASRKSIFPFAAYHRTLKSNAIVIKTKKKGLSSGYPIMALESNLLPVTYRTSSFEAWVPTPSCLVRVDVHTPDPFGSQAAAVV